MAKIVSFLCSLVFLHTFFSLEETLFHWCNFLGMTLEVVDKLRISRVRVAKIVSVTGKRLCVRYIDGSFDDDTFW